MDKVKIEYYQKGQETEIHQLIRTVYDEFVSGDYTEEGNQFFYDWIHPLRIAERQQSCKSLLVAKVDSELAGMIEIRDNNTISLLFVDKAYQRQGIARRLLREFLKECTGREVIPERVYVHASPFSVPVYKKLGFVETDATQEENGIKYIPMEMRIKNKWHAIKIT